MIHNRNNLTNWLIRSSGLLAAFMFLAGCGGGNQATRAVNVTFTDTNAPWSTRTVVLNGQEVAAGHVLVTMRDAGTQDSAQATARALVASYDLQPIVYTGLSKIGTYVFFVPDNRDLGVLLRLLKNDPRVATAEPDGTFHGG